MIEAFRKIWRFAGVERANINKSVVVKFLNAVFHMLEVSAIYFVIVALTQGNTGNDAAWTALAFMAVSIIGNAVTTAFSKNQQTHAGYFMAANERIKIGNLLKGVPMGFFNENSLGEVTGVCTTVLGNIEMLVPMVLVDIMGGLIGTVVFTAMILIFEWRVGLVVAAGIFVYFLIVSSMEKKSAAIAPNAQKSQTALTSAVLEYVQGMGIVKSFNLSGRGDKRAQDALEFNRKSNLDMEKLMTPYTIFQELVLQIAGIAMMFVSIFCWANGTMPVANALMCIVMSFLVFGQIKLFGMGMSMLRLASASIDRTLQTEGMEQMDEKGKAFSPKGHVIEFKNVHFSYENKEILHGIDVTLPGRTTTLGQEEKSCCYLSECILCFMDNQSLPFRLSGNCGKNHRIIAYPVGYEVVPGAMMGYYLLSTTKVSEFIFAMQRLHIPEAFIIPFSVMFRFFPTISEEAESIGNAMRMRGITGKKFFKNPQAVLEYRIVPFMMSVVTIGNDLSAAALTRGLGNGKKRTSICKIGFHWKDFALMLVVTAALLVFLIFSGGLK